MIPCPIRNQTTLPRKRQRVAVSCEICRQRKVRCDRKTPCSRCIQSAITCTYKSPMWNAPTPAPREETSTSRGSPPQTMLVSPSHLLEGHELPSGVHIIGQRGPALNSASEESPSHATQADESGPCMTLRADIRELTSRVEALEHLLETRTMGSTLNNINELGTLGVSTCSRPGPLSRDKPLNLNKSRLFGHSHWTHGGQAFEKISTIFGTELSNASSNEMMSQSKHETQALQKKCKSLAKQSKTLRPSWSFPILEKGVICPSKQSADEFARLYITRFESAFRILHVPSFWREYDSYWNNPSEAATALNLKIHLVLAIGSSLRLGDADSARIRATQQVVHSAQSWLAGPLEKDRLTISALQAQCLLILARQALSVGGDLIWVGMGSLVRTAMQMGLHRDPRHFVKLTTLQAEIRRRLWATILEMNIQASLDSGAPPGISRNDFDTQAPLNINDVDIDVQTETLGPPLETVATDTSMQRLMINHLQPRLEILNSLNNASTYLSEERVLPLHSQIIDACSKIKDQIPKSGEPPIDVFKYNMADLLLRRFLLSLHRPLTNRASPNSLNSFSRKACLETAITLISPLRNEEFSRLMLLGGGMFKNRIIHASLAVASELIIDSEERAMTFLHQYSTNRRQLMTLALREACSQLEGRMRLGETTVRLHMKLNVVLYQAECLEIGDTLNLNLARRAKESLEESYSRLQTASGLTSDFAETNEDTAMANDLGRQWFSADFDFDDAFGATEFAAM